MVTRRDFIRDGVAAFTLSFSAPRFLSELAQAQGAGSRNLVVLYLSGGNDALSTLVPYTDSFYYSRRPTLAVPAESVLQIGAGAMAKNIGTKAFWVQTGGYDTHSGQNTNAGAYNTLMATLNDGLIAFYNDLRNQGLLNQTLILQFSEFGRRISENGSAGTDHGAGGLMLALGGGVRGGLYGTAASLIPTADNPTLENNGGDVKYETDFRSVYAGVLDNWLGADSVGILGADFRSGAPTFI